MSNITYKGNTQDIPLTKWPGFIVVGEKVTEAQAAEILIKTDFHLPDFRHASNDRAFDEDLCGVFGVPYDTNYKDYRNQFEKLETLKKELGMISNLEYIANERIVSSWIDGPHGWCDWSGNIFCNTFNIGKWPDVKQVAEEWSRIAEAFPFLNLKSQLMSGESGEDNAIPVVEFVINDGTVVVRDTKHKLVPMVFDVNSIVHSLLAPGRERGITLHILEDRLHTVYGDKIPQYR